MQRRASSTGPIANAARRLSGVFYSSSCGSPPFGAGGKKIARRKKKFPTFIPPLPVTAAHHHPLQPLHPSPTSIVPRSHHCYHSESKYCKQTKMATKMEGMEHSEVHYFQRYGPCFSFAVFAAVSLTSQFPLRSQFVRENSH